VRHITILARDGETMLKTYLYLPDELNKEIIALAKRQKKSKAEVMREALKNGLESVQEKSDASCQVLFKLAELGKKHKLRGPKDGSLKLDEYLWRKEWKDE